MKRPFFVNKYHEKTMLESNNLIKEVGKTCMIADFSSTQVLTLTLLKSDAGRKTGKLHQKNTSTNKIEKKMLLIPRKVNSSNHAVLKD